MRHFALTILLLVAFALVGPTPAIAAAGPSPSPDATHPRVTQQTAQEVSSARTGTLAPFTPVAKQAAVGGGAGPQREIFGFALASSLTDPTVGDSTWDYSALSTVAFFGLHVNNNGSFATDSGWNVWNSSQMTDLMTRAGNAGTKVVLTIIDQDFSAGTPNMCAALSSTSAAATITNTVNEVKAKGVQGVNVDFEGLNGSCGTTDPSWARHQFTAFVANLRSALSSAVPGSYLSIDTYASSAMDSLGFFDIPSLNASADSFFVMAYDLEYSNYARAPTHCGSFCLGPTAPLTGYYYNDTSTADQYRAVVPASKVILGIPYYGRKSCVASPTPNQYPTSGVAADTYLDAAGEAGSNLVKPGTYATHRDANDAAGQERWDTWVNTTLNCTRELYWDDTVSLGHKYALVNADNLRGVGIWNLNYGGGAPELWSLLHTYFACPVTITVAATETATQFDVGLSAGNCAVAYFEVQEFDSTLNQGWFGMPAVPGSGGVGTGVGQGYQGHSYEFMARAHSVGGVVSAWSVVATTQVSATATLSHPWNGLYTLDGYGGIHQADSPPLATSAYWPGWKIARAARAVPGSPDEGLVLDGYGGLHGYGAGVSVKSTAYWPGWDIARDFALLPDGTGGYVLDGYGGLHPFGLNGHALPPAVSGAGYWGWDVARKVAIFSDGSGGYVMDAYGGLHSFGIGGPAPAQTSGSPYWAGWQIARDLVVIPGSHAGYVLDGYGGMHGFAPVGQAQPAAISGVPYWGWDIARGAWLLPTATPTQPRGYVLDGYGGLHPFGGAPAIASSSYWPGWAVAIGIMGG